MFWVRRGRRRDADGARTLDRHRTGGLVALFGGLLLLAGCGSPASTDSASGTADGTVPGGIPTQEASADPAGGETNPAGDIPDTQVFVEFTPPGGGYALQVPQGWARTDDPSATTFTDKFNSIRIVPTTTPAAPTVSTGQAELAAIRTATPTITPGRVTTEQRPAGPVLRITYRADSTPNSVTGKSVRQDVETYEYWNNGTQVSVTLSGPVGADNVDPWRTVTDSFRWAL